MSERQGSIPYISTNQAGINIPPSYLINVVYAYFVPHRLFILASGGRRCRPQPAERADSWRACASKPLACLRPTWDY